MSAPLQGTASGKDAIARVRYSHDAMIDLMIERPMVSQGELARYFSLTEGWVSRVIGSDAFQARLASRKEDLVDPLIRRTLEERIQGLAAQSLQLIEEKLDTKAVPFADVLKTFELTTKALGLGARDRTGVQITNNYVVALPAKSVSEDQWVKDVTPQAAIDVEMKEASNG